MLIRNIWEVLKDPGIRTMLIMLSLPLVGFVLAGLIETFLAKRGVRIFNVSAGKQGVLVSILLAFFYTFMFFLERNKLSLAWGSFAVFGILFIAVYRSKSRFL